MEYYDWVKLYRKLGERSRLSKAKSEFLEKAKYGTIIGAGTGASLVLSLQE